MARIIGGHLAAEAAERGKGCGTGVVSVSGRPGDGALEGGRPRLESAQVARKSVLGHPIRASGRFPGFGAVTGATKPVSMRFYWGPQDVTQVTVRSFGATDSCLRVKSPLFNVLGHVTHVNVRGMGKKWDCSQKISHRWWASTSARPPSSSCSCLGLATAIGWNITRSSHCRRMPSPRRTSSRSRP